MIFRLSFILSALTAFAGASPSPSVNVYFSPHGGCADAIVQAVGLATNSVHVQAYSFTSAPIAKALIQARKRGVDVVAVLDKSQKTERFCPAKFLTDEGIPVFIDSVHKIAHNKVMVIDGNEVITGSFNFTKAAEESNAENLLIIKDDPDLAGKYEQNWKSHKSHSTPYTP